MQTHRPSLIMKLAMIAVVGAAFGAPLAAQQRDSASQQSTQDHHSRTLGVYDAQTSKPLDGVEVDDLLNGTALLTSRAGTVRLPFRHAGGSLVRLRKVGYEPQTLAIGTAPADTTPVSVMLSPVERLAPVVVNDSTPKILSPVLRAFDERRRTGLGRYLTDSVFRRDEAETMADIIPANIPGVMTVSGPNGKRFLISSRGAVSLGEAVCYVDVYVDGVKLNGLGNEPPDFARMTPFDYVGAEYCSGATVPPAFNPTGSRCGVLLLWTRER